MGQLKSRVQCPDCKKESITFDPFMLLSVPLPQVLDKKQLMTYVSADPSSPLLDVTIVFPAGGRISDMKKALAEMEGLPHMGDQLDFRALHMVEVFSNKIYKTFKDDEFGTKIVANDKIWMFEVPMLANPPMAPQDDSDEEKPAEMVTLTVLHTSPHEPMALQGHPHAYGGNGGHA